MFFLQYKHYNNGKNGFLNSSYIYIYIYIYIYVCVWGGGMLKSFWIYLFDQLMYT